MAPPETNEIGYNHVRVSIFSELICHFGLSETKTKKLNNEKLVSSLIQRLVGPSEIGVAQAEIFVPAARQAEAEYPKFSRNLYYSRKDQKGSSDSPNLSQKDQISHKFFDSKNFVLELINISNPKCLVIEGSRKQRSGSGVSKFAENLATFNPTVQESIIAKISAYAGDSKGIREKSNAPSNIVIQESVGKFSELNLMAASSKISGKYWKSHQAAKKILEKTDKKPVKAIPGWGVAAFLATPKEDVTCGKSVNIAHSEQIFLRPNDLGIGAEVFSHVEKWCQNQIIPALNGFDSLLVLNPYASIVGSVLKPFTDKFPQHENLDISTIEALFFGWNPDVHIAREIFGVKKYSLIIDLSDYPKLNLVAAWI